jgi:tRNA pseudouridine38-40 synthase
MVRTVVGTLLEVGYGNISLGQFREIIEAKDRQQAGASAPAESLFLWDVGYEF